MFVIVHEPLYIKYNDNKFSALWDNGNEINTVHPMIEGINMEAVIKVIFPQRERT